MAECRQLAGRVAVVTGGSRGIGAAACRRLAREGASVVVNYARSAEAAMGVVRTIEEAGGAAAAVRADLSEPEAAGELMEEAIRRFGGLHILVNNAAVAELQPLERIDLLHYQSQFDLNVRGLLFATREAVRRFPSDGGVVLNVSSGLGANPGPKSAVYSATKAAVNAITRSLAQELGPRGIRVNAVAPGTTDTEMLRGGLTEDSIRSLIAQTPLGRLGTPEEIAEAICFLCTPAAGWITGEVLGVNGGLR